jgi:hypothetical protein
LILTYPLQQYHHLLLSTSWTWYLTCLDGAVAELLKTTTKVFMALLLVLSFLVFTTTCFCTRKHFLYRIY